MPTYVIINEDVVQMELARLPLRDRGLLSGLALCETIRVEAAVPLRLQQHIDQLATSISSPETALDYAISPRRLERDIATLCAKEKLYDCLAHYIITPGEDKPWQIDQPTASTILYLEPLDPYSAWQQKGVALMPSPTRKVRGNLLARHNFVADPQQACALKLAAKAGYEIVAYTDQDNQLLDTSAGAIALVKDNALLLPHPERDGINNTVYRQILLQAAAKEGVIAYQQSLTPDDCASCSEILLTSPGCIVAPVTEFAGRHFKEHPIACKLLLTCREMLDKEKPAM